MGSEFLNETAPTGNKTNTEIFEECFPFYFAIGMSSAEYWEGDASLTRYFRKAYKIRQEEKNNEAWLQGLYFYDAVCTALHNAFSGKNTEAKHYPKQPYNFENRQKTPEEQQREIEIEQQKAAAWMENFVRINQSREP